MDLHTTTTREWSTVLQDTLHLWTLTRGLATLLTLHSSTHAPTPTILPSPSHFLTPRHHRQKSATCLPSQVHPMMGWELSGQRWAMSLPLKPALPSICTMSHSLPLWGKLHLLQAKMMERSLSRTVQGSGTSLASPESKVGLKG